MTPAEPTERPSGISRRRLLIGGAAAGLGAAAAVGIDAARGAASSQQLQGSRTIAFHGTHQAGVVTTPPAHGTFLGLDLKDGVDREGLRQMMRVLSDDAARLTQGEAALADSEPELAVVPAALTITFGFGPEFVRRASAPAPAWLRPLPAFGIDQLQDRWSGGDLLIEVAADDPVTVAHAVRMLLKDARSFATVRWVQPGFRRAAGSEPAGTTMRNLFGQIDGTANLQESDPDFDRLLWIDDGWLAGGTSFVLRRIEMDLDEWDRLDRDGREQSVGRRLANGAPLTGQREHDEPDFAATDALGFPVIAEFSHVRRARSDDPEERILRRAFNYDDPPAGGSVSNSGLLFGSFQADVDRQFVPIQRRLDELDLLNQWTTPIGSAVFAIPPGCAAGGYVGETLLG